MVILSAVQRLISLNASVEGGQCTPLSKQHNERLQTTQIEAAKMAWRYLSVE